MLYFSMHKKQEGLASPFQQKLGFTQMLHVVRVDTSNAYTYISIFVRQGPFSQVRSHIFLSLLANILHM